MLNKIICDIIKQLYQSGRNDQQLQENKNCSTVEKKTQNRIDTIKQRKRNYKHEIIRRAIDSRFTINTVKEILKRFNISYKAVNITKSRMIRSTSLFIGMKYRSRLRADE